MQVGAAHSVPEHDPLLHRTVECLSDAHLEVVVDQPMNVAPTERADDLAEDIAVDRRGAQLERAGRRASRPLVAEIDEAKGTRAEPSLDSPIFSPGASCIKGYDRLTWAMGRCANQNCPVQRDPT